MQKSSKLFYSEKCPVDFYTRNQRGYLFTWKLLSSLDFHYNIDNKLWGMEECKMRFNEDYFKDVLVRMAHHSSGLEGNTITLPETVSIILHKIINGNRSLNIRELYEIANHEQAFDYMLDELGNNQPFTIETVKIMHRELTDRLQYDRGMFKKDDNAIIGATFQTASAQETPSLMAQWIRNLQYQLEHAQSDEEKIKIIGDFHIQFERIHPFSDGNGRTGRMIMNYSLLQQGLPPLIIQKEQKADYIKVLSDVDRDAFYDFCLPILEQEKVIMRRFENKLLQHIQIDEEI